LVDRIHNSVCAIGYLPIPLKEWKAKAASHPFKVVGSGFLVRATTVMTNRHVIRDLLVAAEADYIPDDQLFISFIAPIGHGKVLNTVRMVRRRVGILGTDADIGFIEFKREPAEHFEHIHPLAIDETGELQVTEEVYVCGYPHGNRLMEKDGEIYRLGPVMQHGYISGLSPFGRATHPDEILLDVRTARGMSGSPVFRPGTGAVIGIHNEAIGSSVGVSTTAFAIPLRRAPVIDWLSKFDESPESNELDSSTSEDVDA
jgi:S1-C subfamily serine protease